MSNAEFDPNATLAARLAALQELFSRQFGAAPTLVARAPGRVNLIGEHTDYNDGYVFPIAIERDTLVALRPRDDGQARVYSATIRRASQWSLARPEVIEPSPDQPWSNYVRGVTRNLLEAGVPLPGADMAIASTVPLGAGVSSSAAFEMATGAALLAAAGQTMAPEALALLCQRVENQFVGVNSGIMDQFISGLARADHALLLDCRDRTYRHVPLPADQVIGVADSGVKHGLVASEYNARRAECETGVRLLRAALPAIRSLRDVSPSALAAHADLLPERELRRCRHVVAEIARTVEAAAALQTGDLVAFGERMYASHASLRDDYEVSAPELDALVEAARDVRGVFGSRMTGGGFGGSTVTLMERRAAPHWDRAVRRAFRARFGRSPTTFVTRPAAGAGLVWP